MKNLEYNPVFESLLSEVRKVEGKKLNEEAVGSQIDASDIQKYLILILDVLQINVISFSVQLPQALVNETLPSVMEKLQKLGNNASMDDLIEGLNEIWDLSYAKIKEYKGPEAEYFSPAFDKANEGVQKVLEAYGALKKKAGDRLNDKALLDKINGLMKKQVDSIIKSIEASKKVVKK